MSELIIVFETDIYKINYNELEDTLINREPYWEDHIIRNVAKRPYTIREQIYDENSLPYDPPRYRLIEREEEMMIEYLLIKPVFYILDFFIDESTFNYIIEGYDTIMIVNSYNTIVKNYDQTEMSTNVKVFKGIPINREYADKVYITTKVQSDLDFALIDTHVSPEILDISRKNLEELPSIYSHIKSINCSNNHIISLKGLPRFLERLDCSNNNIDNINILPESLVYLQCNNNELKSLTNLLPNLKFLNCSYNIIEELNCPKKLKQIYFNGNRIKNIDNFPDSIETIDGNGNEIYFINNLPMRLSLLSLEENNLVGIQEFNDELLDIQLDNNFLRYLPLFPKKLRSAYFTGNSNLIINNDDIVGKPLQFDKIITTVDEETYEEYFEVMTEKDRESTEENTSFLNKNDEIKELNFTNENIVTIFANGCENLSRIEALPPELIELCCSSNPMLNKIEYFPKNVLFLFLSNNPNLQTLPPLPENLYCLICNNCDLRSLPPLPENIKIFDCRGNPNITISMSVYNEFERSFDDGINIVSDDEKVIENRLQEEVDSEILNLQSKNLVNIDRYLTNDIKYVLCNNNEIESIRKLPKYLIELSCDHNRLRNLPELPETLEYLDCSNNNLMSLPHLPEGLKYLDCSYNNIQELYEIPDSLEELSCIGNYNMHITTSIYNRFPNAFSDGITIITRDI